MDVLESQLRLGGYCDHLLRNTETAELQKIHRKTGKWLVFSCASMVACVPVPLPK